MNYVVYESRKERRIRKGEKKLEILAICVIFVIVASLVNHLGNAYFAYSPVNSINETLVHYNGELYESGVYKDKELYFPLKLIKNTIDPTIKWDKGKNVLIITTSRKILYIASESEEESNDVGAYVTSQTFVEKNGEAFLVGSVLEEIYSLEIKEDKQGNIIFIHNTKNPLLRGKIVKNTVIRNEPSIWKPWSSKVENGDEVNIFREDKGWFWVETDKNQLGYIHKKDINIVAD